MLKKWRYLLWRIFTVASSRVPSQDLNYPRFLSLTARYIGTLRGLECQASRLSAQGCGNEKNLERLSSVINFHRPCTLNIVFGQWLSVSRFSRFKTRVNLVLELPTCSRAGGSLDISAIGI